jgi:hypothetical protein
VHLARTHGSSPAVSTIWRILSRRGFITSQPQKRPRSTWIRFEAEMPNQRWQADITHWQLADGAEVEILNIEDDHSRLDIASDARATTTGHDVLASFRRAFRRHGIPAPDNIQVHHVRALADLNRSGQPQPEWAQVMSRRRRKSLVVCSGCHDHIHGHPPHRSRCSHRRAGYSETGPSGSEGGRAEKDQQRLAPRRSADPTQTQKKWLTAQPAAETIEQLQRQLDRFRRYYNTIRPPPSTETAHPRRGLRRPAQGRPHRPPHPAPLPGPQGQSRRHHHHPAQQPAPPHRTRPQPRRHQSHRPRSRHTSASLSRRNRRTHPRTGPRPRPRLPAPRRQQASPTNPERA